MPSLTRFLRHEARRLRAPIPSITLQFRQTERLFFQPRRSSSLELLFSCHFGLAAASIDALRRSKCTESSSALGENRLFREGASSSSGHPGRVALRAADEADASQNEIRYYVQLHPIRGRSRVVPIESMARKTARIAKLIFKRERKMSLIWLLSLCKNLYASFPSNIDSLMPPLNYRIESPMTNGALISPTGEHAE